jgi:hypothetical protein
MPKPKHDRALLRTWLAQARDGDALSLVCANVRDATSLRNALYHLQGKWVKGIRQPNDVRIERSGRMLTLRAARADTQSINARSAKLTNARKEVPR